MQLVPGFPGRDSPGGMERGTPERRGGGRWGNTAARAISKARDVVAGGKSKGTGTGPGLAEIVLGVALRPPLNPPPPPPLAIPKARDVVAGGNSMGKGTGPGATEVLLGAALGPPPLPPPSPPPGEPGGQWGLGVPQPPEQFRRPEMSSLEAKARARAPVQGSQWSFGGSLFALSPTPPPPSVIPKARDVVAGGKSKGKGTGPGLTEVVLGAALCPPPIPPRRFRRPEMSSLEAKARGRAPIQGP